MERVTPEALIQKMNKIADDIEKEKNEKEKIAHQFEGQIKPIGHSGMIICPNRFIRHKARVTIWKEKVTKNKDSTKKKKTKRGKTYHKFAE